MGEKYKRFMESLKITLKNLGSSTGKVLENLEKSDKEINDKIAKAVGETNI